MAAFNRALRTNSAVFSVKEARSFVSVDSCRQAASGHKGASTFFLPFVVRSCETAKWGRFRIGNVTCAVNQARPHPYSGGPTNFNTLLLLATYV